MRFVYLVQGAAARVRQMPFPSGAAVFALCYDEDVQIGFAAETIFDPKCSWAEGRNKLVETARAVVPDFDYLILCDDDVSFAKGSFERFQEQIQRTQPLAALPLMPKARLSGGYNRLTSRQKAIVVDEQMYALHRDAIGITGVCPLVTDYDHVSWHTPCLIFEYVSLTQFGRAFHQYNDVVVDNANHTWETGTTNYNVGKPGAAYEAYKQWIGRNYADYDECVLHPFWKGEHRGADALKFSLIRYWKLLGSLRIATRS
jgi:hypothetical protein